MKLKPQELADLFRRNLRARRLELELTQVELAGAIGAPQSYVSAIERGRICPNLTSLATIAEALDTTPSALISSVLVQA